MNKILILMLAALVVLGSGVSFADVQIDEGLKKGTAAVKFFMGRNGRETIISKDRVVVWDATSKDGYSVIMTTTSFDTLRAGITMDEMAGVSTDSSTTGGYGRVQTWGLHNDVRLRASSTVAARGPVCTSDSNGLVSDCMREGLGRINSGDNTAVGYALQAVTTGSSASVIDIMVNAD